MSGIKSPPSEWLALRLPASPHQHVHVGEGLICWDCGYQYDPQRQTCPRCGYGDPTVQPEARRNPPRRYVGPNREVA